MTRPILHFEKRREALNSEYTNWEPQYRDLADNLLGSRSRFLLSDRNKGHKRNTRQFNNTAKRAARVLQAGMMAGMSSPARPWFRLGTLDVALRERGPVKRWLADVERLMYAIYAESNFYGSMSQLYFEYGTYGTVPMAIYENFEDVIRCQTYTVGSYRVAANGHGRIDTFYRTYDLKVDQLVHQFGFENVSKRAQKAWMDGNTEIAYTLTLAIEPNDDRDGQSVAASDLPWRSVYYEHGQQEQFLRRSGFHEFPLVVPRWDVLAEDAYANDCPGMIALGDQKALQGHEIKKAKGLDKMVDPPLAAPTELRSQRVSQVPGDVTYVDSFGANSSIRSIYDVRLDFAALLNDTREIEARVKAAYFEDLFLMFQNVGNRERVTAEEIIRKQEEKLLMLGPMLERAQHELFDPVIDRTFNMAVRADIVPDPPPDLEGRPLRVEYISPLFSAQKQLSANALERTAAFVGNLAQGWPSVVDKFDADQAVDEYSDAQGTSPRVIRTDDEASEIRDERERAARAREAIENAESVTAAGKNLSETDTSGQNALTDLQERLQP